MKKYAILLDNTNCTGCNSCAYRCIQEFRYHGQASRGLFRTFVEINDEGLYQKRCMHCQAPDCVANCPVKALTKSEYGPVLYNAKTCIGCKTCVKVCPFNVPQFDDESKKIVKCSMCAHKVSEGKQPSCVETCPTSALQFGEYDAIAAKAKAAAAKGKLKVYGLKENGGTSLFVLAKTDPVLAGYPKVAAKALKNKASLGDMAVAPAMVALAVGGFKKFTERKDRIRAEEAKKSEE